MGRRPTGGLEEWRTGIEARTGRVSSLFELRDQRREGEREIAQQIDQKRTEMEQLQESQREITERRRAKEQNLHELETELSVVWRNARIFRALYRALADLLLEHDEQWLPHTLRITSSGLGARVG